MDQFTQTVGHELSGQSLAGRCTPHRSHHSKAPRGSRGLWILKVNQKTIMFPATYVQQVMSLCPSSPAGLLSSSIELRFVVFVGSSLFELRFCAVCWVKSPELLLRQRQENVGGRQITMNRVHIWFLTTLDCVYSGSVHRASALALMPCNRL